MTLIRKQNAIDVFASKDGQYVVITEEEGYFNEQNGEHVDIYIGIDMAHIDAVIEALQKAKAEILAREANKG